MLGCHGNQRPYLLTWCITLFGLKDFQLVRGLALISNIEKASSFTFDSEILLNTTSFGYFFS